MLNEAFLERFPVTFEQEYPTPNNEVKILNNVAESLGIKENDFTKRLVDWADIIRKTFYDGGVEEIQYSSFGTHHSCIRYLWQKG